MDIIINENDVYRYTDDLDNETVIYGSLNGKFEVGDTVEVIDQGEHYSSYELMANAMGILLPAWKRHAIKNGYIGEVISRKVHGDGNDILYGVQFSNSDINIIGESGLKSVDCFLKFKSEDFEL